MISLGIFARTFQRSSLEDVLDACIACGYKQIHFNMTCVGLEALPSEIPAEIVQHIRQALSERPLRLCGVSGTYNMAHPDEKIRQEGLERLEVLARSCKAFGTDFISLCTGTCNPEDKWAFHPDNTTKEAWARMQASVEAALDLAHTYDIQLGIEPELANIISDAKKARQLISDMQSPRLKIILDPANLYEIAKPQKIASLIAESLELLADSLCMAHAKGKDAQGNFVAAGKGSIPFAYFVQELKKIGFEGPLVTHGLNDKEAADVFSYLHDLI